MPARGACALRRYHAKPETFYLSKWRRSPKPVRPATSWTGKKRPFRLRLSFAACPKASPIVDRDGVVKFANLTFLDLVQAGVESAVVGKSKIWFTRPGTGLRVISEPGRAAWRCDVPEDDLEGDLGVTTEVEVSAVADQDDRPRYFALIIRDVVSHARSPRRQPPPSTTVLGGASGASLESAVRSSVEAVERQRLADALSQSGGNRTAAAKALGISRQSLHTKLKKYRL